MQTKARSKVVGQVLLAEQNVESKKSEKRVRKVTEDDKVVCRSQLEILTGERA